MSFANELKKTTEINSKINHALISTVNEIKENCRQCAQRGSNTLTYSTKYYHGGDWDDVCDNDYVYPYTSLERVSDDISLLIEALQNEGFTDISFSILVGKREYVTRKEKFFTFSPVREYKSTYHNEENGTYGYELVISW